VAAGKPTRVTTLTPGLAGGLALLAIAAFLFLGKPRADRTPAREILGSHGRVIREVVFSPDGRTLAAADDAGAVTAWDVATRQGRMVLPPLGDAFRAMAFAPDGATVAVGSRDDGVTVFDLKTGRAVLNFPAELRFTRVLACRPGGAGFALGQSDGTVTLYSASGRKVAALGKTPADVLVVAVSPDGRRLAAADVLGTVVVWDLESGRQAARFSGARGPVERMSFAPAGTRIAATCAGYPCPHLLDLGTGRERAATPGMDHVFGAVAFSPDGGTLALSRTDGCIMLWDVGAGRPRATLRGHRGLVWALAFSPDGRRLASGGDDMTVRLWDVPAAADR
jgi:WD40 repeat protein